MPERGRVLMVEDDAMIRELLRIGAEDAGFEPILAGDDRAAVAALEAGQAHDLVGLITDINLGRGRSGWFVAQLARTFRPELPVVYVTGDSGHEWRTRGVAGSLLLLKPFTPLQVMERLRIMIDRASGRE